MNKLITGILVLIVYFSIVWYVMLMICVPCKCKIFSGIFTQMYYGIFDMHDYGIFISHQKL